MLVVEFLQILFDDALDIDVKGRNQVIAVRCFDRGALEV